MDRSGLEEEKGQRGKVNWWLWGQRPGLDKQSTRVSLCSWGLPRRLHLILWKLQVSSSFSVLLIRPQRTRLEPWPFVGG